MKNNNRTIKFKKNLAKLNKNRKNIKLELIQGASTLLNINNMSLLSSCNNMKNNIDYLNMGYNHTENIGKSMKKHKLESTFINPESHARGKVSGI